MQFLKMPLRKWVVASLLLFPLFFYLYYRANDTFLPAHVVAEGASTNEWAIAPLEEGEKEELAAILRQPFTYLAKGCQSYVFASRDGKYVLKLVKYQRYRNRFWLDWLASWPLIGQPIQNEGEHRLSKLRALFNSYHLAYNNLKEETGLVFLHLDKSPLPHSSLLLYDRLGFKHQFDADNLEFMIQKKCESVFLPTIEKMIAEGREEEAKRLIDDLLVLLLGEYSRGWVDQDMLLTKNIGIHHGLPVKIDVGRYRFDPSFKQHEHYFPHLLQKSERLRIWLEKRSKPLAQHLSTRLEQIREHKKLNISAAKM